MSHYGMAARILGFVDSPEYLARKATPFKVPNVRASYNSKVSSHIARTVQYLPDTCRCPRPPT
jgi:hypothetical protein